MRLINPVFLHGWGFSSKVFGNIPAVKIDLPGHGKGSSDYRDMNSLVEEIALSLPSSHDIVGWSMGGSIALMLALRFPSKVRRLFLIGTSPYFGGAWSGKNVRALRMRVKREGIKVFRRIALSREFEDEFKEDIGMRMLEDYINLDLRDQLPTLKRGVFIIQGDRDLVVPPLEAYKLRLLIKGSKLVILPGGHFPFEDERSLLSTLLKVSSNLR
ncbi:MAG: alpha/beta fold hydrolase [Aquificae bacterium]|nr:alpha/beta fold hydrolase [Aquificota bacterium]